MAVSQFKLVTDEQLLTLPQEQQKEIEKIFNAETYIIQILGDNDSLSDFIKELHRLWESQDMSSRVNVYGICKPQINADNLVAFPVINTRHSPQRGLLQDVMKAVTIDQNGSQKNPHCFVNPENGLIRQLRSETNLNIPENLLTFPNSVNRGVGPKPACKPT